MRITKSFLFIFIAGNVFILPQENTKQQKFTHADTLRGMLTSLRACYDVIYYDLEIKVNPKKNS